METKTITITVLIALLISLGSNLSIDMFTDGGYICEARLELGSYPCDSFSQYYGLENGKCLNADTGNKLCNTGWIHLIDEIDEIISPINVLKEYKGTTWECEGNDAYSICTRNKGSHQAYYNQLN